MELCPICRIGAMRPTRATYARWHGGQFILLPGVPAWRCDYCGDLVYDETTLARLIALLGPPDSGENEPALYRDRRQSGYGDFLEDRDRRRV